MATRGLPTRVTFLPTAGSRLQFMADDGRRFHAGVAIMKMRTSEPQTLVACTARMAHAVIKDWVGHVFHHQLVERVRSTAALKCVSPCLVLLDGQSRPSRMQQGFACVRAPVANDFQHVDGLRQWHAMGDQRGQAQDTASHGRQRHVPVIVVAVDRIVGIPDAKQLNLAAHCLRDQAWGDTHLAARVTQADGDAAPAGGSKGSQERLRYTGGIYRNVCSAASSKLLDRGYRYPIRASQRRSRPKCRARSVLRYHIEDDDELRPSPGSLGNHEPRSAELARLTNE